MVEWGVGASSLAHTVDISRGGMRFQCVGLDIYRGEALRVRFSLGKDMFDLYGTAVRIEDLDTFAREVGLSFNGLDPGEEALLASNLRRRSGGIT